MIQCKISVPNIEGLQENQLTVGREFLLICEGEFPKALQTDKVKFLLPPEKKYDLKLLGFELRSFSEADFKVTSYKTGIVKFDDLQVTDGAETFGLGPLQFNVTSVLPKPEQGEAKVEPYGPIGPASMSVPFLYWALAASVIGVFFLLIFFRAFRSFQRRNMIQRLKEHDSALSPLAQFHQSYRRLQRMNPVFFGGAAEKSQILEVLQASNDMFRLFLTRRFQIPAIEWSDRLILKDMRKYHPQVFNEFAPELKKIFKEYQRGFQDKETLAEKDVLNIATHTRILVERMGLNR